MAFGGFIKSNLWQSLVWAVGTMIGVWGFLADAQSLWTAGIKPDYLQLSGFIIFVAATVSLLYRQHQVLEQRLGNSAPHPARRQATAAQPVLGLPSQPASTADRTFVSDGTSLERLIGLYEGHTDLQGEKLTHVYLGKWIRVDGVLKNLYALGGTYSVHINRPGRATAGTDIVPRLAFSPEWADRLATIPVGAEISVIGKIRKIESHCVWIDDCELVEPTQDL